jgi:hypothetical protein
MQDDADASLSELDRCRKRCARHDFDLRRSVKERDELFEKGVEGKGWAGNPYRRKEWVQLKSRCRKTLAAFRAEVRKYEAMYISDKEKLEGTWDSARLLDEPESLKFTRLTLELLMERLEGRRPTSQMFKPMRNLCMKIQAVLLLDSVNCNPNAP